MTLSLLSHFVTTWLLPGIKDEISYKLLSVNPVWLDGAELLWSGGKDLHIF